MGEWFATYCTVSLVLGDFFGKVSGGCDGLVGLV